MKHILKGLGLCVVVTGSLACSGSDHPGYPPDNSGTAASGGTGGAAGSAGTGGTEAPAAVANVTLAGGYQPPFDVSGDGKYLFFVSIGDVIAGENPTGSEQLFMFEVETGALTQLTDFADAAASGLGSGMNDKGHGVGLRANEDGSRVWIKGSGEAPKMYEIKPRAEEPTLDPILPVAIEGFTTSDDFSFTVIYDWVAGIMNTRRFDEANNQAPDFTGNLAILSKVGVSNIVVSGDGQWVGFDSIEDVEGKPAGLFTMRVDGTELTYWQGATDDWTSGHTIAISHTASTIFVHPQGRSVSDPSFLVDVESGDESEVLAYSHESEHLFGGDSYLAWVAPASTGSEVRGSLATAAVDKPAEIDKIGTSLDCVTGLAASSDGSVLVTHSQQKSTHKGQLRVKKY